MEAGFFLFEGLDFFGMAPQFLPIVSRLFLEGADSLGVAELVAPGPAIVFFALGHCRLAISEAEAREVLAVEASSEAGQLNLARPSK